MSTDAVAGFSASRPDLAKKWGGRFADSPLLEAHLNATPEQRAQWERDGRVLLDQLNAVLRRHNAEAERIIRRAILNGDSEAWHFADPALGNTTTVYDMSNNGACDATGFP